MKLFDNIRKKTSMMASTWKLVNGIDEAFVEDSLQKTLGDTYGSNPWVNLAVKKIAQNINRASFQLMQNDKIVESGPAYKLFYFVNPYMSRYQLWEATVSWLQIQGESIWTFQKDYNGVSLPKEIYVHNPSHFTHVLNKEKTNIIMWQYQDPMTGDKIPLLPGELIHFKDWNPWNQFRGINPLIAATNLLSQEALIDATNLSLLKNKSTPSGILTSELPISETQAKEYITRWEKTHGGANRSGRIAVMGSNLKYQTIGLTPEEMQYFNSKKWNRSTIMSMYGVPPAVAGFRDDQTPLSGKDTKEQLTQFWNQTLVPIIKQLQDKLTTDFTNRWTPAITYLFDTTDVPELQTDADVEIDRLTKQISSGTLTINEAREEIGRDPVPWGDTWYKPINVADVTDPRVETKDSKAMDEWFQKKPEYPSEYKYAQWLSVRISCKQVCKNLYKVIKDKLYALRSDILGLDIFMPVTYPWDTYREDLRKAVESYLPVLGEMVKETLPDIVTAGDITYDYTEAARNIAEIIDGLPGDLAGKNADEIREVFKETLSESRELCKRVSMQVINEQRMEHFRACGYRQHEYIGTMENTFNVLNGDVTTIGYGFSHGKAIPHGDGSITLPVLAKEIEDIPISPKQTRDERYEELYKQMTAEERDIEEEVKEFWDGVEKELDGKDEDEKVNWLNRAGLGLLLFGRIRRPIKNTFTKGMDTVTKIPPDTKRRLYEAYLEKRKNILSESGSKVTGELVRDITSGQYTPEQLKDKIAKTLGTKKSQAATVAQTETTAAFNSGIQNGIEESDYPYKQWFHAGGGKVDRPHHMMDQIVPKNETFTLLNGVEMFAPGDGPVSEVVSCHCVMIPKRSKE